jgi:hypothetical protein
MFYNMLDMIPIDKEMKRQTDASAQLSMSDMTKLADIYNMLLVPENSSEAVYRQAFTDALQVVADILITFDRGTTAIGGTENNNSKPPVNADATPVYIRKAIYFITYTAYVYTFGLDRKQNTIPKAGYQVKVLRKIADLTNGKVKLSENSFTKWGLHPEYDFIEGTYRPKAMPFKYMGQKSPDLLFMLKSLAESVKYSTFIDGFGGSGVCSLARAHNKSVDEYINDFDYRNVAFYLAMTEHFDIFEKECLKVVYRIENPDITDDIYKEGDSYWHSAVNNLCVKLQNIVSELSEKRINWNTDSDFGTLTAQFNWGITFTPDNVDKTSIELREYLEAGSESDYFATFGMYLAQYAKIENTLRLREVYSDKSEIDKLKYAQGLYKYYDNLPLLLADGSATLQDIGFKVEYAVAFIYLRLFMQVQPSISWVNIESLHELDKGIGKKTSILSRLRDLVPRFKTIGVLWMNTIDILTRPNSILPVVNEINDLKKKKPNDIDKIEALKKDLAKLNIFTKDELEERTRRTITDVADNARFLVRYYENMLVYLDSPYVSTAEYAGGGFPFNKYRDAVDSFIGKYIYSCRFSAKTSKTKVSETYDIDEDEKAEVNATKALEEVKTIYNYYKDFKSVQYVCIMTDGKSSIQDYISINLFTDKLEVMLTNFDFALPNSDNMKKFSSRANDEFEFDRDIREANEIKFVKLGYDEFLKYVENAIKVATP